jgi:hypothetical protein
MMQDWILYALSVIVGGAAAVLGWRIKIIIDVRRERNKNCNNENGE